MGRLGRCSARQRSPSRVWRVRALRWAARRAHRPPSSMRCRHPAHRGRQLALLEDDGRTQLAALVRHLLLPDSLETPRGRLDTEVSGPVAAALSVILVLGGAVSAAHPEPARTVLLNGILHVTWKRTACPVGTPGHES